LALCGDELGGIVGQPRSVQRAVEREDHDRVSRHASQFDESSLNARPLVNAHPGHRRIERTVVERQILSDPRDRRHALRRRCARIADEGSTANDVAVLRLVGPGTRATVQHSAGRPERGAHGRCDPRVGASLSRMARPVGL
jgi:hypothetical protein